MAERNCCLNSMVAERNYLKSQSVVAERNFLASSVVAERNYSQLGCGREKLSYMVG